MTDKKKRSTKLQISKAQWELLEGTLGDAKRAGADYPMKLGVLLTRVGLPESLATSVAGARNRPFVLTVNSKAALAVAKTALAVLTEDADALAVNDAVLVSLIERARTASNQAFSVSKLGAKLPKKLQPAFAAHWKSAAPPEGVGALVVNNSRVLFSLHDVEHAPDVALPGIVYPGAAPRVASPASPSVPAHFDGVDVKARLLNAFDAIDADTGKRNYVKLYDLRRRLADVGRAEFDEAVHALRSDWVLTLEPAEGRHVQLPDEVLEAAIIEESTRLVYAARRET